MTFSYRGIDYQMDEDNLEAIASFHPGHYRGVAHQILQIEKIPNQPTPQSASELRYRGIRYRA